MTATFTWMIDECERTLSDGGVTLAHWRCEASETRGEGESAQGFVKASYGSTGFDPTPDSSDFIPYESLTQAQVLDWVWAANEVNKEDIQNGLQDRLNEDFTPTKGGGVPWSS